MPVTVIYNKVIPIVVHFNHGEHQIPNTCKNISSLPANHGLPTNTVEFRYYNYNIVVSHVCNMTNIHNLTIIAGH